MKKVLIVEDEAIIAAEIEYTLTELGYQIAGKALSGDRALDLLKSAAPDIALLDIHLKGSITGIDLAKIIRHNYNFPFVFLTAYADSSTIEQVKETMPYGYIVKPFTEEDLSSNIELALHKFSMEQKPDFPKLRTINKNLQSELTDREYEILTLLSRGLTYKDIGSKLFISVNTVKSHQKKLFAKLSVNSRHQAISKIREFN